MINTETNGLLGKVAARHARYVYRRFMLRQVNTVCFRYRHLWIQNIGSMIFQIFIIGGKTKRFHARLAVIFPFRIF